MADSLLLRCARACYRADEAPKKTDWSHLTRQEQRRYEVIAAAALSIALSEPVYTDEFDLELSLPSESSERVSNET
jgi:hypothetical protein